MSPLTRAFGLVVSALLAALSGCTSDNVPAGQCRYDSDCDSPLVCVGTFCRAPCATDRDCPANSVCARGLGGVQICAARDAPRPCLYSSDCPATTFCTRDGICQSRCRGDYDCQVINPFNSCVEGSCQLVCPAGFADCDGDVRNGCEVDTRTSAQHCGRCANACSGADGAPGVCRAGACVAPCATGFADCDGAAANGCEADLSQSDHCGSCATRCSGERALCLAAADPGTSARSYSCQASCPPGTTTCGTRCADLQSDPASCGRCDEACPSGAGATPTCEAGRCGLRCAEPAAQGDCDGMAANGCEVELRRSPTHCGACGSACPSAAHATPACADGACRLSCETGWGNCDGDAANGCETDLTVTGAHCGMCGNLCAPRLNGSSECAAGVCVGACAPGFGDCDGDPANGCEVGTTGSVAHCGGCGRACAPRPNTTAACAQGACQYRCGEGFLDCDGDPANGCEVDASTSTAHCGGCGRACSRTNGTPTCAAGSCAIACSAGFGNCDGDAANGCETDTASNTLNCGACRTVCSFPGSGARCDRGTCVRTDCGPGLGDCDGMTANGCETTLSTDSAHCGACGNRCVLANATAVCRGGGCAVGACNPGYADCDGVAANGCEVALATDALHCGSCPLACNATNGAATCVASTCRIACSAGFGNCDASVANGCEVDLRSTVTSCGACGRACALAHATSGCAAGACTLARCDAGWADCDANVANGCETDLGNTVSACGACGRACALPNATPACRAGACAVSVCNAGYGDCDGVAANGCETNLATTVGSCGACGRACALANATPACAAGACTVASCAAGFGNCDGVASNGCEVDLRGSNGHCGRCGNVCGAGTVCSGGACGSICGAGTTYCGGRCVDLSADIAHCGACGAACPARANAATTCAARVCGYTCNAGYADCDGNAANGCEVNLATSVGNCGRCANACALPNATPTCAAGLCAVASCAAGFGNCDGNAANGCETSTATTVAHCGACGNACVVANGTPACRAGACAVASCAAGYGDCDGSYGSGCEAALSTDIANCGACGTRCAGGTQCAGSRCVPVNDTCQTATPIDLARGSAIDLPFTVVNADHTTNLTTECVASTGGDVYFSFTLTRPELVYADTFGAAFDTVLFIARDGRPRGGACDSYILGGRPGEVWCNDDAANTSRGDVYTPRCGTGGAQSMIVGRFLPGTYFLGVAGYASASGAGTVHFQHLPLTTNGAVDYIPNVVTGGSYSFVRRPFVTPGTVSTTCGGGAGPEDTFWWRSCPEAGAVTLRANTCGTATPTDTIIDVRHASGAAGVCNDDAGSLCSSNTVASNVTQSLPAGAGLHTLTMDTYRDPAAGSLYYLTINPIIIGERRRGPFLGSVCLARAMSSVPRS
ncbi:MAG: hypothetical protein EPO40_12125 [Myxococcaceae bacterium]|nr:MAG: hypothetical protein EPO40_12125 [Myxococcaceae bacterium]